MLWQATPVVQPKLVSKQQVHIVAAPFGLCDSIKTLQPFV